MGVLGHISFVGSGCFGFWICNGSVGRWSGLGNRHGGVVGGWVVGILFACNELRTWEILVVEGGACDARKRDEHGGGGGANEA